MSGRVTGDTGKIFLSNNCDKLKKVRYDYKEEYSMKMKNIISTILILGLLFTGFGYTPVVQAETTMESEDTDVASKTEIPEGYIGIYDISDLAGIKNNLKGNYILMNDIDMSETAEGGDMDAGNGWTPINDFAGILDGNGYRIKNMHIFGEINTRYVGLFGSLSSGATVKNLGLLDVDIDVTYTGNSTGYVSCGGVAGYLESGMIEKSFVTGKISVTGNGNNNYRMYCGGIIGCPDWGCGVINCYNTAEIQGEGAQEGYTSGIVGYVNNVYGTQIEKCYNLGNVNNGEGNSIVGGECGYVFDCFFLKGTGTEEYGSPLSGAQMKKTQWFTNFDFENVWEMDANYIKHPYPQLKSCMQNKIKEISIETLPDKTEYQQGDKLDLNGGILKIVYEDDYDTTTFLTEDLLGEYDMTKLGAQEIKVRKGNASTMFRINVNEIPTTGLILDKTNISLYKGYSDTITATVMPENATYKDVTWSSAVESIAIVDQDGMVTAKGPGTTEITAKSKDGYEAKCIVTVNIPAVMIQLWNYNVSIELGQSFVPMWSVAPLDSTDKVKWISSDENILHIDENNNCFGVNPGVVTATAMADSGVSAACTVTVTQDISQFAVTGVADMTYTGGAITQNPVVTDGAKTLINGVDYVVTYTGNINVGTATMTISGISPYIGTITREFKIVEASESHSNTENDSFRESNSFAESVKTTLKAPDKVKKLKLQKKNTKQITSKSRYNLSWGKVKGADGYEIQGYVSSVYRHTFTTKNLKIKTIKKNSLKNQRIYWLKIYPNAPEENIVSKVRVRAYKVINGKRVYGRYSSWKTILPSKQVKKWQREST